MAAFVGVTPDRRFMFVSNIDSISRFSLDGSGSMRSLGQPTTLSTQGAQSGEIAVSPSGSFLYIGTDVNAIEVFKIEAPTGNLLPIQGSPFPVPAQTALLKLSANGQFLYAIGGAEALYTFPVDTVTGTISATPSAVLHTGLQLGTLEIHPSNQFLFVSTLTAEKLLAYRILPTGALQELNSSGVNSGYGALQFTIAPNGKWIYLPALFDNTIVGYSFDANAGTLTPIPGSPFHDGQTPSSAAASATSEILAVAHINPGSVVTYKINQQTGALTLVPGAMVTVGNSPNNLILVKN